MLIRQEALEKLKVWAPDLVAYSVEEDDRRFIFSVRNANAPLFMPSMMAPVAVDKQSGQVYTYNPLMESE